MRQARRTRSILNTLRRVQLSGAAAEGESDSGKPIQVGGGEGRSIQVGGGEGTAEGPCEVGCVGCQTGRARPPCSSSPSLPAFFYLPRSPPPPLQVALSVVQDISRLLPLSVLPSVLSGWAALVRTADLIGGAAAAPAAGAPAAGIPSPTSSPVRAGTAVTSSSSGAIKPSPSPSRPVNRARQLKMQEPMSDAARQRWLAMDDMERRVMAQVLEWTGLGAIFPPSGTDIYTSK